jgi:hypothetical protein
LRKATLVSAEYLNHRYGHPIETMLQMASIPVEELASRLRISLHEVWIERRLNVVLQRIPRTRPVSLRRAARHAIAAPRTFVSIVGSTRRPRPLA